MARRIRRFHAFQTFGWKPGTRISYYAEKPHGEIGVQIKTKRRRKKK